MDIVAFQRWVEEFYEKRSWSQYNAFIRLNFLTEEVGEVSRVVRAIEITAIALMKRRKQKKS